MGSGLLLLLLAQASCSRPNADLAGLRARAEAGEAGAQFELGEALYNGSRGVPPDEAEAVKWYRQAAGQNNVSAQLYLAICCENGTGVKQDKAEAYKWFRVAAEQGSKAGRKFLDTAPKCMSSDEIAEGAQRAAEWLEQFKKTSAGGRTRNGDSQ